MSEFWKTVLMFVCGAGGLAVINLIQERWKVRYQRKAEKEDREEEKDDKFDEFSKKFDDFMEKQTDFNDKTSARLKTMENNDKSQQEAMKYVLLDRIIYIGQSYIKKGQVTFDERKRLRDMHDVYHNSPDKGGLGGNGDAKKIMEAVDELPLAK
jgi:chromatin remodeling complex protein RSC6